MAGYEGAKAGEHPVLCHAADNIDSDNNPAGYADPEQQQQPSI